jgi:PilZ domain
MCGTTYSVRPAGNRDREGKGEKIMRHARVRSAKSMHQSHPVCNRRIDSRIPVEFGLMYSAMDDRGELIMGDGAVVDLSNKGLGIRGNMAVNPGLEMTLFLYLPDGQDPLFVMEARVAWSAGTRFGVEILKMNLRERNRLRYFLSSGLRVE